MKRKKINRLKYIDAILESSEQMLSLLNTLLSYYRLDTGKEQPENAPFKLKALVDILDSEFSPLAENKGLTFVGGYHGDDVVVMGDRKRIIQIANNLLSNAIKFTSDGYVILQVDYMNDSLTISVSDSGKGMSEEQIKRIYPPFERFGATSEQEGFGLGLPITLGLVNLLGGTIDVKSDIGKGCIFTVRLPLSVCTDEILLQQSVAPIELSPNLRIAVVDNDTFVLKMTTRMLASCKVKADGCNNVGELMERMRTIKYDLMITDMRSVNINEFNSNPKIINFMNGILNIDTLQLTPHDSSYLFNIQMPVNWNANFVENPELALSPVFDKYLDTLTKGYSTKDAEDIKPVLLEVMGVVLSNVPGYKFKKAFLVFGEGNTGKTQIRNLAISLIGEKNSAVVELADLETRDGPS